MSTSRRSLGLLTIESSPLGDGQVGILIEGPPAALNGLAIGLRHAGLYVEQYDDEPGVLYAKGSTDVAMFGSTMAGFDDDDEKTGSYQRPRLDSADLREAMAEIRP